MTEKEFKSQYIVTFVATYTATHYDDNCLYDRHEANIGHHIMEDAVFLADYAWKAYCEKTQS